MEDSFVYKFCQHSVDQALLPVIVEGLVRLGA